MRPSGRSRDEMREFRLEKNYVKHAEGSVLVELGNTRVLCTASVVQGVPRFLKGSNQGWITAEYGMLPRSTHDRIIREATRGKQSGRTQEIQRLIGRSLRAAIDLKLLPEYTITIDCDVIQADGGTRTASITGGCVALFEAIKYMQKRKLVKKNPIKTLIASVSVGIYKGLPVLDLDYDEDSKAQTDMNLVMTEKNEFIELQGTAEAEPFKLTDLQGMIDVGQKGITEILRKQKEVLEL